MTAPPNDCNPNLVKIDLDALTHNARALSALASETAQLMPVVKSDAYGHGLLEVSRRLKNEDNIWGLGISTISEAYTLRRAGIDGRLFLLSGCFPGEEDAVMELGLTVGVVSVRMLNDLQQAAFGKSVQIPIHVKVDTGMGRYGLEPEDALQVVSERKKWPDLLFQGLYTHMPVADQRDDPFNLRQIQSFESLIRNMRLCGWEPEYIHMANSAGLVNFPQARFNLARPGIGIYGHVPGQKSSASPELKPVLSFESRIASVRAMGAGTLIGYGRMGRLDKNSLVAVVPAGYDDGYMRSLSNRGKVLVKGVQCNILGTICMKAFMVDVSAVPDVAVGDRVVMIGRSGECSITADELASRAGTISYELMCLIGSRNRRIYLPVQ